MVNSIYRTSNSLSKSPKAPNQNRMSLFIELPEAVLANASLFSARQPAKSTPAPTLERPLSTAQPSEQQPPPNAARSSSTAPPTSQQGPGTTLTYNGKPGSDFPAPHTSTLDINAIPIWPGTGKPLTSLDIDADLAEHTKPWRLPGTDQTDYFNYGFDEYAWTQYCIRQQSMRKDISEQQEADNRLKAMFGGPAGAPGGAPSGPGGQGMGGGGGMVAPPGMPDPDQLMQQMMASGMNPAEMRFEDFMAMAGPMAGGPGGPGGPPNGPAAMSGGYPQNSISPANGQGFAAPTGPQGGGQMDGYSAQQMAMMGGGGGGGGRGRGGRRGRGYY